MRPTRRLITSSPYPVPPAGKLLPTAGYVFTVELEREWLRIFRSWHGFPVTAAMQGGHLRFEDDDLLLLKGDINAGTLLARAAVADVRYWQPPRWLSNGVKLRMGTDDVTWTVMTVKNGAFALRYAQRWADGFAEVLAERGAQPRHGREDSTHRSRA